MNVTIDKEKVIQEMILLLMDSALKKFKPQELSQKADKNLTISAL